MWAVQVTGDAADLAMLARSLTGAGIKVFLDGQEYLLTSDRFAEGDEAKVVRQKADDMLSLLDGASRLGLNSIQSIRAGGVYRLGENGRRDAFVFLEAAVLHCRALAPTVKLTHTDGTVEEFHPADPVKEWIGLALTDDAIAKVFQILASGSLDWVNLYRIFEIIMSDVGGLKTIQGNGWATKTAMELFKRTANSPGASGLEARHGAETTEPPERPMTISEARALVTSIVRAWLRSKATGAATP
jgi:hypothetical protein